MEWVKGDICLVNFNPAKGKEIGKEIGKIRPAIIISKTEDNQMLDTVVVIPLSTSLVDDALPYRLRITKRAQLEKDSDACIYEIRALSKTRIKAKIGSVSAEELLTIKNSLFEVLF